MSNYLVMPSGLLNTLASSLELESFRQRLLAYTRTTEADRTSVRRQQPPGRRHENRGIATFAAVKLKGKLRARIRPKLRGERHRELPID